MEFVKKIFTNKFLFLLVFIIIAVSSNIYYYDRVIQKDESSSGQICYSDFRVFWFAGYNLRHYTLLDGETSPFSFRPFWFLNHDIKKRVKPYAKIGEPDAYIVYDKKQTFYHFRYSPFVAFLFIPFGKMAHQGHALMLWYALIDISFLVTLLLSIKFLGKYLKFKNREEPYIILWIAFLSSLRFFLVNISLGQTDMLVTLLLMIFIFAYAGKKEIIAGIVFALILQFKLFFLPILLYCLMDGKIKIVISTIISFVIFLFIPSYLIGFEKNLSLLRDWIEILRLSVPSQILNPKNQSIVYAISKPLLKISALKNLFNSEVDLFYAVGLLLTLSSYTYLTFLKKVLIDRLLGKDRGFLLIPALIVISMISSPIAWQAHFTALMIPLCFTVLFALGPGKKIFIYSGLAVFFLLSCILGTDLTKFLPGISSLEFANIGIGALVLLVTFIYGIKKRVTSMLPVL